MSHPRFYLGIDFGTSYFKVGLFDANGGLHGLGRVAVETTRPDPLRVELPIAHFWSLLRRALGQALDAAQADVNQIAGLSYSSQANTFVLLDENDAPLTPLILWTDRRAGADAEDAVAFSRQEVFRQTAGFCELSADFAIAKWQWFQRHRPELWQRVRRIMTLSDYFVFSMTGERAGDAGTAAFLGLLDLNRQCWWDAALQQFGIEKSSLSVPLRPGTPIGRTHSAAASLLGLPAGLPFALGGLDHQVAALGSGLGTFADVSISTGTVLAAMTLVRAVQPTPGCYHGPHFGQGKFYRLSFDPNGAGQLEAYRQRHAADYTLDELSQLAASAPAGAGEPDLAKDGKRDADAHGAAIRFLMEKIAKSHQRLLRQVGGGGPVRKVVATGGGTRSPLWLQIKADTLGLPVMTPAAPERACLGAAMLASVAKGTYHNITEASEHLFTPGKEYPPHPQQ